jgi:putative membrane protein
MLATVALAALLSLVGGPYPGGQPLQQSPTAATVVALTVAVRRRWLSDLSFGCLCALLLLHVVGARWIYSYVPYDAWCVRLVGWSPRAAFGWSRNHWDRLVHLAFGALCVPFALEFGLRRGLSRVGAALVAVLAVGAFSALYEVFEWALAMAVAPERAERYLGQQGDRWDAQRDMALALAGAVVAAGALLASRFPTHLTEPPHR